MNELGKLLVIVGLLVAAAGAVLWSGAGRRSSLGRLPGDIHYSRGHFSFYFPVVTCLLLSAILTLLLWLFSGSEPARAFALAKAAAHFKFAGWIRN